MPRFYVGAENPNSGPHAYVAGVLPAEPSPIPGFAFLTSFRVMQMLLVQGASDFENHSLTESWTLRQRVCHQAVLLSCLTFHICNATVS